MKMTRDAFIRGHKKWDRRYPSSSKRTTKVQVAGSPSEVEVKQVGPDKVVVECRPQVRYVPIEKAPADIVEEAALNLAIAHAHRLNEINIDDVVTAFKSVDKVIGMPQKTVQKVNGGKAEEPAVKIRFLHDRPHALVGLSEMRNFAQMIC